MIDIPEPHLMTAHQGPLNEVEQLILDQIPSIEAWFRKCWQATPAPIASSVDLRHAGFKLAPVDTNLFPAGFNNLNPASMPLCIQAVQSVLAEHAPYCTKILILPESHTRNQFYFQSVSVLRNILAKAGFVVKIGSLDPATATPRECPTLDGDSILIEPLVRQGARLGLENFNPCLLWLNNDLSAGVPEILNDLEQPIKPGTAFGWESRLKSRHFECFNQVVREFSQLTGLDPWRINPMFCAVDDVDFMAQAGLEAMAEATDRLLTSIRAKYDAYGIQEKPFVVVKSDHGTYGMGVMMIHDADELFALNRKQRTKMSVGKGRKKVRKALIQEGVYTFETMPDGAVAEPVVYMIGQYVVGGFYRVHKARGKNENLNAPGMHFEPLAFAQPCNMPREELDVAAYPNRFYVYGVIARLATLAAAREMAENGTERSV